MANKLTSVQDSGTSNFLNPLKSVNKLASVAVTPGVLSHYSSTSGIAPTFGYYGVNAQGSPNMSVAVTAGDLVVNATPTGDVAQNFIVNMDVNENVTIASNSTGSTKTDFIYLQLDATKLVNPAVNGLDAASLIVQRSTTASVDSNGAASNALLLAEVSVANGAVSITNSNIIDRRVRAGFPSDGWIPTTDSWTYSSATAITVPTGAAGKYAVGDKIRLFQSGSIKYFYIVGVADTTLTITGGSDYTLANATISQQSYSHAQSPIGFPQWFSYTPTNVGWASTTVNKVRFALNGRVCTYFVKVDGTSNGTTTTSTLPITGASNLGTDTSFQAVRVMDNSGTEVFSLAQISNAATTATFYPTANGGTWTATGRKIVDGGIISYEI